MSFSLSHIYRRDNCCLDRLASHDIFAIGWVWWDFNSFPLLLGKSFIDINMTFLVIDSNECA